MHPQTMAWPLISEEDKDRPLGDFEARDILSEKTLRDIKNNNDKLR